MKFAAQIVFILLTVTVAFLSCGSHKQTGISGMPPEIPIPKELADWLLPILEGELDHFPSESRIAQIEIDTPEQAYSELRKLYPEKAKRVDCWSLTREYFVFSLGFETGGKCTYLSVLYVPKDGKQFRYFWPHT